jgi:small subunit ribosomal protein S13
LARIAGVDLPRNKRIEVALTYIFGIGHTAAGKIIQASKVDPGIRVNNLTDEQIASLRNVIEQNFKVEGAQRLI